MNMTEDQDSKDSQSDSGCKAFINKNKDKKSKPLRPLTKIIIRRLPPTVTEEAFLEQVSPIPEHDYFYFAKPDTSLGNLVYSRAYINFINVEDIYIFKEKFDGYVFLDEKGVEYVGIVEYAPFQRVLKKKKKKDPKCGTLESDPVYQVFVENLNKEQESDNQPKLEYSYPVNDGNDKKVQSTPLLEYLASRKQDKRSRDERRRRENDKRKMRIERKTKEGTIKEEDAGENEVKKIKPRDWEKDKVSIKSKEEDGSVVFESKTYREQKKQTPFVGGDKKRRPEDKRDTKDEEPLDNFDKGLKKDKYKDSKSKKYSDTRKERVKQVDVIKSDKQSTINKFMSAEGKSKSLNHDDIKPFTQLPHVKTDDLTKLIEDMDRKAKLEEKNNKECKDIFTDSEKNTSECKVSHNRKDDDSPDIEEFMLNRQHSFDDSAKSTDREGSEEKDKSDYDRRLERRIRNKDRPSLVIYQPGMGKFSKQRITKDTTVKSIDEAEKQDT